MSQQWNYQQIQQQQHHQQQRQHRQASHNSDSQLYSAAQFIQQQGRMNDSHRLLYQQLYTMGFSNAPTTTIAIS